MRKKNKIADRTDMFHNLQIKTHSNKQIQVINQSVDIQQMNIPIF